MSNSALPVLRRTCATFGLALSLALQPAVAAEPLLHKKLLSSGSGKCLDGSPALYYIDQPTNLRASNSSSWVFHLNGGGACYDKASCTSRSKTKLGSSSEKFYKATQSAELPLQDSDCTANPTFCNARKVVVPYCSGDAHSGNRTTATAETWGLYFSGHANFVDIIEELTRDQGLGEASHVLLTGNSAGGLGTFINLDWLAMRLPGAVVKGAPNAGWFFPGSLSSDQPGLPALPPSDYAHFSKGEHGGILNTLTQNNVTLDLWQPIVNTACAAAQVAAGTNPSVCSSLHTMYKYIKSPLYVLENQYDTNQIEAQEGMPKHAPEQLAEAYLVMYGAAMRNSTKQVLTSKKADGLFHPSCFKHGVEDEMIGGNVWLPILADWFWEVGALSSKYRLVESCPPSSNGLPCNALKGCTFDDPSPSPGPAPGACSAQLAADGCLNGGPVECDACALTHRKDLNKVCNTQKQVKQLCAAAPGPAPPAPGPGGGACEKQLVADGCTDKERKPCTTCAATHAADLRKVGCTDEQVIALCGGTGPESTCAAAMTKDGCLVTGVSKAACEACAKKNEAGLEKAGCKQRFVSSLCAATMQ